MNFLKSLFVSVYMTAAMMAAVYAGWMLWLSQDYLTWGGVLLVTAPFVLVIGALMLFRRIARTSAHFASLIILGVVGVMLSHTGYARGRQYCWTRAGSCWFRRVPGLCLLVFRFRQRRKPQVDCW